MMPSNALISRTAALRAGLVAVLLAVAGCVPTFDDNLSLVREPIVLAVQSEPAEAAPGESVRLTVLAVTGNADNPAPEATWGLCVARKPLTELGPVNPICIRPPNQAPNAIVPLGTGASVQATLPAPGQPGLLGSSACQLFGPSLPEAMNGEPAGRPVDPDPTGGFYQPVGVTLLENGVLRKNLEGQYGDDICADFLLRFFDLADFAVSSDGHHVTCVPVPDISEETVNHLYLNQVLPLALSMLGKLVFQQGPAMIVNASLPMVAFDPTRTSVEMAENSLDASLYGLSTGITDSTPGSERRGTSCSLASSPMQPMMVRRSPRER